MANDGLLNVIESLAQERNLDQETLLQAIESALVSAAKKAIGPNGEYRVEIDRKSGEMRVFHRLEVVEKVVAKDLQISLEKARKQKPDIQMGAFVEFRVESEKEFGRIAAQTARQTIMHKIREAEKERVFTDYKDRAGEIVRGTVRRFDRNDVIIELETAEAVMPSSERVPTEERSATVRSRSWASPARPGSAPRFRFVRPRKTSIRSAPASACAAFA